MAGLVKTLFASKSLKMALVVRTDLKLSKGKTAAQCAHAAIICYQNSMEQEPRLLKQWCQYGQAKVVLKVDNLSELLKIQEMAQKHGIVTGLVVDAGRTQVEAGTCTVLGLGPERPEKLDAVIRELKLL
jgi:peptidyl-tRNA hydrolase, PTH2 family